MRVLVVGMLPPPFGGMTLHVEATARILRDEHIAHRVISLRSTRRSGSAVRRSVDEAAAAIRGVLALLAARRHGAVVLFNISDAHGLAGAMRVAVVALLIPRRRGVLIPHSGHVPDRLAEPGLDARILRAAIRRMGWLYAVGDNIARAAGRVLPSDRIACGSSFLGLPALVGRSCGSTSGGRTFVTSGYTTPIYCYEELIDACERARMDDPGLGLTLCLYGDEDADYAEQLGERTGADWITVHHDLDHDRFLALLADSAGYLRATRSDAYGVAVAEALSLGVPALATDVCARAPGCLTYEPGDLDAIVGFLARTPRPCPTAEISTGVEAYRTLLGALERERE